MNIVIDNGIHDFMKIANCLRACGIPFLTWNKKELGELDMIDTLKPEVIFYSPEVDLESLSYGLGGNEIPLIYVGDLDAENPQRPSLVIGSSKVKEVPCLPVADYMVDIFGVSVGKYSEQISCNICCFTETLVGLSEQVIGTLVNILTNYNARFFGSMPLDIKNYLGPIGWDMRSDLCASSNLCVDISGQMWGEILYAGGNPVVSTKEGLKVTTFSNFQELEKLVSRASQMGPPKPTSITKNISLANKNYGNVMAETFEVIGLAGHAQIIRKEKEVRL